MSVINILLGFREFAKIDQIRGYIRSQCNELSDENIDKAAAMILFETTRQRTWLLTTEERMFCVLDDVEKENFVVRWSLQKEDIISHNELHLDIQINSSYKLKTGMVDFGSSHKGWLYSKKLYSTEASLRTALQQLISIKMLVADKRLVVQY